MYVCMYVYVIIIILKKFLVCSIFLALMGHIMTLANFDFCNPNLFFCEYVFVCGFLFRVNVYVCIDAVNELELYNNNMTRFLDQIPYLR